MTTTVHETAVEQLGQFISSLALEDVPPQVIDKARACLLHGIVVGLAGVEAEFPEIGWATIPEVNGPESARLLVNGRRTGRASAAFGNGVLLHARVQEDTHGTTHIGTTVIPAALAVAESTGADGERLLEAIVAGYEVAAALAKRYTPKTTARGFRASAIYGPFAAATATAKLLGLDARASAHALAFASAFAGGTTESFTAGSMEWHFENGIAAQNGVIAGEIAAAGGIGAARALEGRSGFLQAFAGTTEGVGELASELGTIWELMNVTFKLYPVCAFNQSPVTAIVQLAQTYDVRPSDVERIEITMNEYEANYPGMTYPGPFETVGQTQMSTPFCLALGIVDRGVSYDGLHRFDDAPILDLVSRVEVRPDPAQRPMTARIRVTLKDGTTRERALEQPAEEFYTWGFDRARALARDLASETPFSLEQIEALADEIAQLGRGRLAARLVDLTIKP